MIKHYKRFLRDTVQLKTLLTTSGSGVKTYGTPVDVLCYIATDIKSILDADGEATISTIQLYFDGDNAALANLKSTDLFTIDRDYPIKRQQKLGDGHGASSLLVVYI